jgi:hypothetical protein
MCFGPVYTLRCLLVLILSVVYLFSISPVILFTKYLTIGSFCDLVIRDPGYRS